MKGREIVLGLLPTAAAAATTPTAAAAFCRDERDVQEEGCEEEVDVREGKGDWMHLGRCVIDCVVGLALGR